MNIIDFSDSLEYIFKAQLTAFVWGHSGIGKSSIVAQYAKKKGYHFFPFYLGSMSDTGDILGLANFVSDKVSDKNCTEFAMPVWLSDAINYCNANPDSGAIIFLDEFNRAPKIILNGVFSLALDKTFHTIKLPTNCHVVAAGNPPTDEYYVSDVNDSALMSRFVHVKLEPTVQEWVDYAVLKNVNPNLIGWIKEQPKMLEDHKSEFSLPVNVDRRSFLRLNELIQAGTPSNLLDQLMLGIIGAERLVSYKEYLKNTTHPLSAEDVVKGVGFDKLSLWSNPNDIKASLINVTCDNVHSWILTQNDFTTETINNLIKFFQTIPKDIMFAAISKLYTKSPKSFSILRKYREFEEKITVLLKVSKNIKE